MTPFARGLVASTAIPMVSLAAWLWLQPLVEIDLYRDGAACVKVDQDDDTRWVECWDRR